MITAEFDSRAYLDLTFPPVPADRPYVFVNMVSSLDGKAVVERTERGLGSASDHMLMRRLRYYADMVLNGAGTFRASGTGSRIDDPLLRDDRVRRGLPPNPVAAVLTNSGNLDTTATFFTARDFDAVVFLGPAGSDEAATRLAATGRRVIRLPEGPEGLRTLSRVARHELGVQRLLLEGGPSVVANMLAADLVDELFITVAGKIVGGRDTLTIVEGERFPADGLPGFEPASVVYNSADQELYTRWRRLAS